MSKTTKKEMKEFTGLRLPELWAKFEEVVGERSRSPNRKFLLRRIEEALRAAKEKHAKSAPESAPAPEGRKRQRSARVIKVLPLTLDSTVIGPMDSAWRIRGIRSRMEFLRQAIGHYLAHLGADDVAKLFTPGT
jgi:hypothetical protein